MFRNRRLAVFLTLLVVLLATLSTAQEGPKPGPEHDAMGYFVGKWSFEGEAMDGPMGPGGKMTLTETCEFFEGGFALVCRGSGESPLGPTSSLSIMSYDTPNEEYTYYAVEAGMPPFQATGRKDGKAWRWQSEMKIGEMTMHTKVTVTEVSAVSYTFELEASTDGGSTWQTMMTGTYSKS